jgi:hypothetical protein
MASTSTTTPLAISSSTSSGSLKPAAALLLTRGLSTVMAAISSSNIQRATSMSCTVLSLMIMSLV